MNEPINPPNQQQQQTRRAMPRSELDLTLFMTDSLWGKEEVGNPLMEKLANYFRDGSTNEVVRAEGWELLTYFTRDMRLGNLSSPELEYCQYFLELAGDYLTVEMNTPFLLCISRVAVILELSQSRGGFLRKRMTTLTSENQNLEPAKKSLFGGTKKVN